MASEVMYWSELRGLPVIIAGQQSRKLGIIDDFYYQDETHTINALRVKADLHGYRILISSAIRSFSRVGVTVANEHMLIDEANAGPIYHLPLGDRLVGFRVVTEKGRLLGVVSSILLGIYPPVALRLSTFELGENHSSGTISAVEITRFGDGELVVTEQEGKKIH